MLRILRFIFTGDGHKHEWEWVNTKRVTDEDGFILYYRIVHKCNVCGNYRQQRLKG